MVVFRGAIFGKPRDADDARRMLRALSGHGHDVHTAVSFWAVHTPAGRDVGLYYRTLVDTTYVYFRELSDEEIDAYIASGDPFDKVGAYGIQSGGGAFVDHIGAAWTPSSAFPPTACAPSSPISSRLVDGSSNDRLMLRCEAAFDRDSRFLPQKWISTQPPSFGIPI